MKLSIIAWLFAFLSAYVFAAPTTRRSVIVSYPNDTPISVLDEAKAVILKSSNGEITHQYRLIKAFAAKATEKALETVQTYGTPYHALIEDDNQVHAEGGNF